MKFYELRNGSSDSKVFAWAGYMRPLEGEMPFLHPFELEREKGFWALQEAGPPGLCIESGRIWPDFLGNGGGSPSPFLSGKVLQTLRENRIRFERATPIPIATIEDRRLKLEDAPEYFVLQVHSGIEVDFAASKVAINSEGNLIYPKPWHGVWKLRLSTWDGSDLFTFSNIGKYAMGTRLICTEKLVQLAEQDGWKNAQFSPIFAV